MSNLRMTSSLQEKTEPVGARLAGEGVHENAFAGKPGSYEKTHAKNAYCTSNRRKLRA
jgi:hypothetical protein